MIILGHKVEGNYTFPENPENEIRDFRKLNIFVGTNNSGKSRFMRTLFTLERNKDISYKIFSEKLSMVDTELARENPHNSYKARIAAQAHQSTSNYQNFWNPYARLIQDVETGVEANDADSREVYKKLEEKNLPLLKSLSRSSDGLSTPHFKSVYIPILRGIRVFEGGEDLYFEKINSDHHLGFTPGNPILASGKEVFTGLGVYKKIRNLLLGTKDQRGFINTYQNFLKENFFNKQDITLIPRDDVANTLMIDIGDHHKDREIYNVGDGIQSMIISTLPAFENKDKRTVLFIEEPELTLHPSMQRTLIETLLSKNFPNLQVFVTTHSNHFLDLAYDYPEDVSVYSFQEDKNSPQNFIIKNITRNAEIVDILGVRNSSVFLANCVIWVEGVTDRMFIRKILEIFGISQKYKEDYDYAISEFGGQNIDHFDFSIFEERNTGSETSTIHVRSISRRNFIVIDNDGKTLRTDLKFKKRREIEKLVGKENFFDIHVEIENLVPFRLWIPILEKIFKGNRRQLRLKQNYSDLSKEQDFNKRSEKENIANLLKEFFVEKKPGVVAKTYNNTDVTFLGLSKKELMEIIISTLEEIKISKKDFPKNTVKLATKISTFIDNNTKTRV